MEKLVKDSQLLASSSVEEANTQSRITGMTEEIFSDVAQIAKELLELSKIDK